MIRQALAAAALLFCTAGFAQQPAALGNAASSPAAQGNGTFRPATSESSAGQQPVPVMGLDK